VCGEFLSPEALPILERWDLAPAHTITQVRFCANSQTHTYSLPRPASSLSRHTLDTALARRATSLGVDLRTQTRVTSIDSLSLTLDSGETLHPRSLILGVGRLATAKRPRISYVGFKAHFEGIDLPNTLEMHLFPGAYLGLSNIENGRANLACIARPGTSIEALINGHPSLRQHLISAHQLFDWMEVKAPAFGFRHPPPWPNAYFVGDAAGTIAPTCGDGLAMALTSGIMAAEHAIRGEWQAFRRAWRARYRSRLRWGNLAHTLALRPALANLLPKALPFAIDLLFEKTREIR
jgi:flavin-dependent dehydrogenase